ncbi:inhibitor of nuclear factor kappa-B kinase subunit beta isoform X1 [Tribolium castaneum]|uniref:inhibitor of nuclear factor kappa-B kinase subunit beta isoform X1 n=1 Tax=Tribolium castaneum TaxID=7070 RepID=UPI0001DCB447|nr:PREDICTED: inhibitor of nuclear factor kappa-B kinase subunit beta isoform X1 [Tribolium castaneum]|eukprot:XP_008200412.1 PREDICTED: inhibitor of nuclear factor kappa-B kinase subunit beta isoform X1 [Tribolium castaneum]
MEEPLEIEGWKRISILGSGAFGVVALWQHAGSGDYIAIKKCKFRTSGHLSDRQKQRWENEVQIMKTLNCPNIVSFKLLPPHLEAVLLKYNPTRLPLLSMEYCRKGNLRHVLNQAKNSSGLGESDVRTVLADVTQAVSYLHKQNITHRDIKPENIVLQHCNTRPGDVIYKLIDLGYAKELSDSVVSFVGTLHYLAPEIMKTENYDFSVDYWSLGVVAFEVICGVLPFLPLYTPMERFSFIERKKPEHICIYQLHSGSVMYSSELLKENHISTCLKQNIESWLRHVLQFDPTQRRANFPDNSNVFDCLLNILDKKIVTVFSVHTLEFYSYEINESILISTLKDWIARDTKVQKSDQILLSSLGFFDIKDDKYVVDILAKDDLELFVFKKGAFINRETFKLPKCVSILFENCITAYKWRDLRLIYTKALFFLTQESKMLASLVTAFKLCVQFVNFVNVKLKDSMFQINKTLTNLLVRVDCYYNINNSDKKLDMECAEVFRQLLLQFLQLMADLERSIHNHNNLIKKVDILCKRQVLLNKVLANVTPVLKGCDLSNEIASATDLIVKGGSNDQVVTPRDMVKIVSSALKEKDKLLNNNNFQSYSKAMLVAIKDVETLQLWMDKFHKQLKDLHKAIDDNQKKQHQTLISSLKPRKKKHVSDGYSNCIVHWDADTLINENQELRCHFEEMLGQMSVEQKLFRDEVEQLFI